MTIDELRQAIRSLPPILSVPPRFSWARNCYELRRDILHKDPNQFLTWPTVVGTMFVGDNKRTRCKLQMLRAHNWERWRSLLPEPGFGKPSKFRPYSSTSGNLVCQVSHIQQWERTTKIKLENLHTIVEFGGGYGALCLLVHRLGFQGDYYLYDLPEFLALQEYYLTNVGIQGVHYKSTKSLNWLDALPHADILIGMYSLSETTLEIRNSFLDSLTARYYYLMYQPNFMGVDNIAYFKNLASRHPDNNWSVWLPPCTLSGQRCIAGT